MLRLVCLAFVATCAFGASVTSIHEVCEVTGWSTWGDCEIEANCPVKGSSYQITNKDYRLNEARRTLNMNRKDFTRSQTIACRAAGTCPDLELRDGNKMEADCNNGIANTPVGNMPCENMRMNAFLSFADMGVTAGSAAGNDIWGWTDPEDGGEYSIVGMTHGTTFVRTTNPSNPEVLCHMPTYTASSSWRDMKVVGNTAFIVSEAADHGVQVFDLERLRGYGHSNAGSVPTCLEDTHYAGIGQSHNIAANPETGYLYVVGATRGSYTHCSGGLHMVDVGLDGKQTPTFAGCFASDGYTHDVECVVYHGPHSAYQGNEICFGYNENTLTIVDVTDKSNPVQLSRTGYSQSRYTHQGWNLEDHSALLLDDEQDEQGAPNGQRHTRTYFWDITDLTAPTLETEFRSEKQSIDHNQYIVGDLTYQSNYEAGLRILQVDGDNYELTQKAYFQVRAGEPTAVFRGTWSNYPYFAKNSDGFPNYVATTSIDYGFFTLEPEYNNFSTEVVGHQTRTREPIYGKGMCPALVESRVCQAEPVC